jgi:hypothetical protein
MTFKTCEKSIMAIFNLLSQHLSGRTEEYRQGEFNQDDRYRPNGMTARSVRA